MSAQREITLKTLTFLREHPSERTTLAMLASEINRSPSRINHCVSAEMGEGVGELGQRFRLEFAGHLLANARLGVEDAAIEVGYSSGEALAKAFRTYFLCSPSEFAECNERLEPTFPSVAFKHGKESNAWAGERTVVTNVPGGHCVTYMQEDLRLTDRQTHGYEHRPGSLPKPSEARPQIADFRFPFPEPRPVQQPNLVADAASAKRRGSARDLTSTGTKAGPKRLSSPFAGEVRELAVAKRRHV